MKKVTILFCFMFVVVCVNAQLTPKSYNVISKDESIDMFEIEGVMHRMMVDLYRSQWVDNELTIEMSDGKSVKMILVSANQLSKEGVRFDDGLVRKGAMMSGEAAKESRKFIWKLDEKNEIKEMKEY